MKKLFALAFACLASWQPLAANYCDSYYETDCLGFDSVLTFDIGGGYRRDDLKWRTFPAANPGRQVEERWQNIGLGVVEANAQFLVCEHFLLKADFDYGWFTNSGHQRYFANGGVGENVAIKSRPRGNVYDLSGGLGYQFNLDSVRISFAPLAGYSYHQQRFKSRSYENLLNPIAEDLLYHNGYKFRWSGPWVGFALVYQATCEFLVYVDYSYHWARFRGTVKEHFLIGELPSHLRSNRAYGNEVTVGGVYTFCDYWFVGVRYNFKQFCGHKGSSNIENDSERSALRNLDWKSSTVTLDIGYSF